MGFLHSKTSVTARVLVQDGDKSSYTDWATLKGHLKPYSLDDVTFNTSWIEGSLFKFTVKQAVTLKNGEKLTIWSDKYKVSAVKEYGGITFKTSKILLTLQGWTSQ